MLVSERGSPSNYQRRYRGALRLFLLEQLDRDGKAGTPVVILVATVERTLGLVDALSRVEGELANFEAMGVLITSKSDGPIRVTLAISETELSERISDLTGLYEGELAEFRRHAKRSTPMPSKAEEASLPCMDYTDELSRRERMKAKHNALQAWSDPISGRHFWAELAAAMMD